MGQSTDAILAYGYTLPDDVQDDVDWYDEDNEDGDNLDESAGKVLQAAGITGVSIQSHCSVDYPMYLLTTAGWRAWRGSPRTVDPAEMTPADDWDDKLSAAMKALGLTSSMSRPAWILCSGWG